MGLLRLSIVCACMLLPSAHAQLRTIPEDAKSGETRRGSVVSVEGAEQRLAPGAQIRDAANRILVPSALPDGARVKYLLDVKGAVRQVWILTAEEAAKK